MPLNIAVDVDEVLAAFIPPLCTFHNERYGTSLTPSDFTSYRFCDVWGGDDAAAIDKVHAFFDTPHFTDQPAVRGAAAGIAALRARGHALTVVTSRQHVIAGATRRWLARHFGDAAFDAVLFGNHWGREGGKRSKGALCADVGAHVLIDDATSYACEVARDGRRALLFDLDGRYAWNRERVEERCEGVRRVTSWEGVVAAVDEIEKELGL